MSSAHQRRVEVVLIRHGETEWSASGKHTGVSEIPLTERGRETARRLGARLTGRAFAAIWTSPRRRALETCRLAGFEYEAQIVPEISEWDYGKYEGRTTEEIRLEHPGWTVWTGALPGGESVEDVARRADWAITRLRSLPGDVLLFSHGHFLRVLAARWIGQPAEMGKSLALATGAVSALGWERDSAVVWSWNQTEE